MMKQANAALEKTIAEKGSAAVDLEAVDESEAHIEMVFTVNDASHLCRH